MADPIIDRIDAVLAEDDDIDLMVDAALAVGEPEWAEHGTACTCDDEPELDDIWPGC